MCYNGFVDRKAGAQIGTRAFVQALVILFALMVVAGVLTRVVPAGSYARTMEGGREIIVPDSFEHVPRPHYPIWRWFVAPIEVLTGPDGLTIVVIGIFILMVALSFAVLDESGILDALIARLVRRFGRRRYALLVIISLLFMLLGAFFGIFEEVVPLVPIMIALSYFLGWDSLVGLGMSILATNMGFSAAIMNPFSIGIAQQIAGLPPFSGAWFRVLVFAVVYAVFAVFLVRYARRIEDSPRASLVFEEDRAARTKYEPVPLDSLAAAPEGLRGALTWLITFFALILTVLLGFPFVPAVSSLTLPVVGLLFLLGGVGAGLLSGARGRAVLGAIWQGVSGIAPGIPLILMAASVNYIVYRGGIMDTILHGASLAFSEASPLAAALMVYGVTLVMEFFVPGSTAKAFLLLPTLLPLADLVGVTRQIAVTAYAFGDGFSNMAYPTNPVLLICLGFTTANFAKWTRWSWRIWLAVFAISIASLGVAVAINYGPY